MCTQSSESNAFQTAADSKELAGTSRNIQVLHFQSLYSETSINLRHDNFRVIVDQNVLCRLIRKGFEDFSENFYKSVTDSGVCLPDYELPVTVTPFTIFELLGRSIPPLTNNDIVAVNGLIAGDFDPLSIRKKVVAYFTEHFLSKPEFGQKALLAEADVQKRRYVTTQGKGLIEKICQKHLSNKSIHSEIAEHLAIDRSYGFPYTVDHMEVLAPRFHVDIAQCLAQNLNISQFRGMVKCLEHLYQYDSALTVASNLLNVSTRTIKRDLIDRVQSLRLDLQGDAVDAEFIHFAFFGFSVGTHRKACLCFTMDPPKKVKNRVSLLRIFYGNVKSSLKNSRRKIPSIKTGTIVFIDKTGSVAEVVKVSNITRFFD